MQAEPRTHSIRVCVLTSSPGDLHVHRSLRNSDHSILKLMCRRSCGSHRITTCRLTRTVGGAHGREAAFRGAVGGMWDWCLFLEVFVIVLVALQ